MHPWEELRGWLRARVAGSHAREVQDVIRTSQGGVELVRIPGGSFRMGSPPNEKGRFEWEGRQREVNVPSFYLGRYPVTNAEYAR